ncbi:MAG TPA: hypothetical protein VE197_04265, partial [Mycobacterium sp.]|nr:hypothetical protein [Mycobacterium sp.]
SVLATAMVLPETESTLPLTPGFPAGAEDGGDGAAPAGPGADSGGGGHLPSTAGVISTDCAVGAPPSEAWPGSTLTQLPVVTSLSCAELTSVIFVDGVKSTVAVPCRSLRLIVLPDTDEIMPST